MFHLRDTAQRTGIYFLPLPSNRNRACSNARYISAAKVESSGSSSVLCSSGTASFVNSRLGLSEDEDGGGSSDSLESADSSGGGGAYFAYNASSLGLAAGTIAPC